MTSGRPSRVAATGEASLPLHFEQSVKLGTDAQTVFQHLDDFTQLGAHMARSNWMMAGSRMQYAFDEARGQRVGARVRLSGSVLGMGLEIEEQIAERTPPFSKSWQTIGQPRMLIIAGYRMGFALQAAGHGCLLRVFIDYSLPRDGLGRWIGRLAGAAYARWCVRTMINDAVRRFGREGEISDGRT